MEHERNPIGFSSCAENGIELNLFLSLSLFYATIELYFIPCITILIHITIYEIFGASSRAKFAPTFQPTDETTGVAAGAAAASTKITSYVMPQPPAPVHPQTGTSSNGNGGTATPSPSGAPPNADAETANKTSQGASRGEAVESNGTVLNATTSTVDETNDLVTFSVADSPAVSSSSSSSTPPPLPEEAELIIANLLPRYVTYSKDTNT